MKNAMIALAMCLMACTSLSAQSQNRRGPERGPAQRGGFFNAISDLTEEQKEKIQDLHTKQREGQQKAAEQNREAFQKLMDERREARQKQQSEGREKLEKEMEKILTADQYAAYKKMQEERQQMRFGRGSVDRFSPEDRRGGRQFTMHRPGFRQLEGSRMSGRRRMTNPSVPHGRMGRPAQSRDKIQGEQPRRMDRRGPRPEQKVSSGEASNS